MRMPRMRAHVVAVGMWVAIAVALVAEAIRATIYQSQVDEAFSAILVWGVVGYFLQRDFRKHRDHNPKEEYGLADYVREKLEEQV